MKVIVQHIATEYSDEGAGPTLLLLHGWQDTRHSFDAIATLLSKEYRVIRLDLPGFGQTETPRESWDVDAYIDFVNAFMKKINSKPQGMVGHSFGGRIIIKGVATKVFNPQKIVLISPAGVAKRNTMRQSVYAAGALVGKVLINIPPFLFWKSSLRKNIYRWMRSDYLTTGEMKETFLRVIQEDLSKYAAEIQNETLLIWGNTDTVTPIAEGKTLEKLIVGSKLITLQNCGHFVHKENPKIVAEYIKNFL